MFNIFVVFAKRIMVVLNNKLITYTYQDNFKSERETIPKLKKKK